MAKNKGKRGALNGLELTSLNPKKPEILETVEEQNTASSEIKNSPAPIPEKANKTLKKASKQTQTKGKPGPKSEKREDVDYVKISVRIQEGTKRRIKQSLAGEAYNIHKTQDSFIEKAILNYLNYLQKKS